MTLNLPLALIESAAVTRSRNGIGSIAMKVAKPNRIAFLVLWPNARPFAFTNPEPMLRCITDVDAVAALVAAALAGETGTAYRASRCATARTHPPSDAPYPAAANAAA